MTPGPLIQRLLHHTRDNLLAVIPVVRHSAPQGSMLVAGEDRWTRYLSGRFFREGSRQEFLGRFRSWQLPDVLRRHGKKADITLARVDKFSTRFFSSDSYLRVPEWIRMVAPVPENDAVFYSGRARRDIVKIRKNALTWRISHADEDLRRHINRDYHPYTRLRHGEDAFVLPYRSLRPIFRRGALIWVEDGSREVASALVEHDGEALGLWTIGCAGGDPELLRRGALTAVYQFCFAYARQEGLRQLDLRGCRPCPRDGLFVMKLKWGAAVMNNERVLHDWLVRWNDPDVAAATLLNETPLIFCDGNELSLLEGGAGQAHSPLPPGLARRYRPGRSDAGGRLSISPWPD